MSLAAEVNVRAELRKVEPTMVELREFRIALSVQMSRVREKTEALAGHRARGEGAWKWVR